MKRQTSFKIPLMKKKIRRLFRKLTKKEFLVKLVVGFCGLALIATTILPYIL